MTPLNTDNTLLAVEVPEDAKDFFVNNVGCIRYTHNQDRQSSCIEPQQLKFYAEKDNCKILGTVAKGEVDFDCEGLVKIESWKPLNNKSLYYNYTAKGCMDYRDIIEAAFDNPKESFISLLQSHNLDTTKMYLIIQKQ